MPDTNVENAVNIQIMMGANIEIGHVAMLIFNCPVSMIQQPGTTGEYDMISVPAIKLNARQAMEVGMNLIHIAKLAEQFAQSQGVV